MDVEKSIDNTLVIIKNIVNINLFSKVPYWNIIVFFYVFRKMNINLKIPFKNS